MTKVTIWGPNLSGSDQNKGYTHVHTAECKDNGKMAKRYGQPMATIEVENRLEVGLFVCSDFIAEGSMEEQDSLEDMYFAPCCGALK